MTTWIQRTPKERTLTCGRPSEGNQGLWTDHKKNFKPPKDPNQTRRRHFKNHTEEKEQRTVSEERSLTCCKIKNKDKLIVE